MIRTRHLFSVLCVLVCLSSFGQNYEAYRIYNPDGDQVSFSDIVKKAAKHDVVLFGELHNNPIDHWLQLELAKALIEKGSLTLGAEMFETDDQMVLDEYLSGHIKREHLLKEAKTWPNFQTDYEPLVELAKEKGIGIIATNVPRRYASLTAREGQGALLELAGGTQWTPTLPFTVTEDDRGYQEMKEMVGGHGHGSGMAYLVEAQALKDYTMATNILQNLSEEGVFLHLNGSFHSQYRAGIVNYLTDREPKLNILVIASVEAEDVSFDEAWSLLGDYIIVKPASMTKTH